MSSDLSTPATPLAAPHGEPALDGEPAPHGEPASEAALAVVATASKGSASDATDLDARLELRPLHVPDTLDGEDAADFLAMVEVRNETYRLIAGHDDLATTPAVLLPHYRPDPLETRLVWVVLLDGVVVGRVGLDLPHEGEARGGYFLIELHPDVWGQGIGRRAMRLVEDAAREHGRTVLETWVQHPETGGPRLASPTGFGSIPAEDRGARFLLAHGFTLSQIERYSALDLATCTDTVDALLAEAATHASDYRLVSWTAPTPPEHVAGYAWLKSRMATDTPNADLEVVEEVWDADRVARHDARNTEGGRTLHVVAAQHVETGELCAFNELVTGPEPDEVTHQEDTLVLREHRGHRLGTLVKCENLRQWREIAPWSRRVTTYNAEENRPMLDINEAIGFVPRSYEGAWKKVLEPQTA
ncbi:GNAT family N-acetyltransferase [Miniimonas arenae]|uniref:GNAT family N-acetyltransferase n=1 Tax=Miniimonas arenae TaxID=676201 RepID=A0A5C5BAZ5_9MICO|nr:GNAT family N-acetyltransferase [Miniimonas arenae]TNU73222.1 GNAT family N-acetyltransferase [Miniimonas arenae]